MTWSRAFILLMFFLVSPHVFCAGTPVKDFSFQAATDQGLIRIAYWRSLVKRNLGISLVPCSVEGGHGPI